MQRFVLAVFGALVFCAFQDFAITQSCPEKNGRYPVPDQCDAYIECRDNVGEQKLCPDGLFFNDQLNPFAYPCHYPVDVSCEGRPKTQPAQPTEECDHQFGYFKVGDETSCGQFKNCVDGKAFFFDCPEGLAWSDSSYRCDYPDMVDNCDAERFLGFTCPGELKSEGLGPQGFRFFRSPNDCQRYFLCVNGRPRLNNCGEGLAYNELINACDGVENVTGCAI